MPFLLLLLVLHFGLVSAIVRFRAWWKRKHGKKLKKDKQKPGDSASSPQEAGGLKKPTWSQEVSTNTDTSIKELPHLPPALNYMTYHGSLVSLNSTRSNRSSLIGKVLQNSFPKPLPILLSRLEELSVINSSENPQANQGVKEPVGEPQPAHGQDHPQDLAAGTKHKYFPRQRVNGSRRNLKHSPWQWRHDYRESVRGIQEKSCVPQGQEMEYWGTPPNPTPKPPAMACPSPHWAALPSGEGRGAAPVSHPDGLGSAVSPFSSASEDTAASLAQILPLPCVTNRLNNCGCRDLPVTRPVSATQPHRVTFADTSISEDPQSNEDVKTLERGRRQDVVAWVVHEQAASPEVGRVQMAVAHSPKKKALRVSPHPQGCWKLCKVGQCLLKIRGCLRSCWRSCCQLCLRCWNYSLEESSLSS